MLSVFLRRRCRSRSNAPKSAFLPSTLPLVDPTTRRPYTEGEWRQLVEELAKDIFVKMSPVQVSPAMDAPQFCEEWIELARKTGRYEGYSIKCRGEALDKKGVPKVSRQTGFVIITWVDYEPRAKRSSRRAA